MQKQYRLSVCPDARFTFAQYPCTSLAQLISRNHDICNLVTDMMYAPLGMAF